LAQKYKEENMTQEIKTINLGGVNCYLIKAGDGFILVDTGFSSKRAYTVNPGHGKQFAMSSLN
jgi:hypothetical protein